MKKINKKIFPEDFFDLQNNPEELSNAKNKSKQKDHPKLLNPSNTIKIIPQEFNEIKEEAFEESLENLQTKKNNLKIIIPDKSNEELEPSTSGSSNVKLSPNTLSPLINSNKNSSNLHSENKNISFKNKKEKEKEEYKITAHFINEDHNNSSIKEGKIKRPSTPNVNRYNNIYKAPYTCDNKNMDKYKFNYNFEKKKNGVIVPKKDSKISKIPRQNLFKVGYNNNINRNNNKNNNKQKVVPSRIGQIFGTQGNSPRESSLISIRNNIYEKHKNENKDKENKPVANNNNIKNIKKNKNNSFVGKQKFGKKSRAKSMENKYMDRKNNCIKKNELNIENDENKKIIHNNEIKERKKNYSFNKNPVIDCLSENKLSNVKYQLEKELNNIFKDLPEDFEKYPEYKNNIELIVQNIYGLKDYIYKKSQVCFRKNKTDLNNNKI